MKIVVIGGTGLIGSRVVTALQQQGHEAVAAAPNTGVNTLTGEGLAAALECASVASAIAQSATEGDTVRIAPVRFQPIAADDVARELSNVAVGTPLNAQVDIAGPDRFRFDEFIRDFLLGKQDPRKVIADPHAPYFGAELSEDSLVPTGNARIGTIHWQDWLSH